MSKVVFRNSDRKAVRALLKEVGKERYYCALDDAGLSQSKPLGLSGFFFEYETGTGMINLYHRYPIGAVFLIMPVLGFWAVPHYGWEMARKD